MLALGVVYSLHCLVNSSYLLLLLFIGDISSSLHVLKNLGRGMNRHLTEEEELLQRIQEKTEKADMAIERQNKQMRNLLK